MTEIERILDQLKRAYEGNAWHGPSVREALNGVTAEQAAARPLPGAHSIWELAHHIAVWEDVGRRRLEGDRAQINISSPEDWPPSDDTSEGPGSKRRPRSIEAIRHCVKQSREWTKRGLTSQSLKACPRFT